jgi:ABC-type multidrug transport system fused ATPase/permease subunit
MDHGVIVERGTHAELYAANGVYRRLCDMQKVG